MTKWSNRRIAIVTLCTGLLIIVVTMCLGLFDERVDNNKIFDIIAIFFNAGLLVLQGQMKNNKDTDDDD